jgi:hypothetical protein
MDAMTRATRWRLAAALACLLAGCIGNSPEQQAADALGPDTGPYGSGPYHRAGFPCVTCHAGLWWQPSPSMELAGTIYQRSGSGRASSNAAVEIKDAAGHSFTAHTNAVGNFFVTVAGSQPQQYGQGLFEIPWRLRFPLSVRVRERSHDQPMRSRIWSARSCATCHSGKPDANGNGPVFVEEPSP